MTDSVLQCRCQMIHVARGNVKKDPLIQEADAIAPYRVPANLAQQALHRIWVELLGGKTNDLRQRAA